MTREEAKRFWLIRYENAKDFSDPHWEGQERREHREYVEALDMAIEALEERQMINCDTCPRCKDTYPDRVDADGYHFYICGMSGNIVYKEPHKTKR